MKLLRSGVLILLFSLLFNITFIESTSAITCESCGPKCFPACGTKFFRTCCYNFNRKRSVVSFPKNLFHIIEHEHLAWNLRNLKSSSEESLLHMGHGRWKRNDNLNYVQTWTQSGFDDKTTPNLFINLSQVNY